MKVSKLKVLKSGAGYYIGRTYRDGMIPHDLPYDRQTGYFGTPEEAAEHGLERFADERLDESVREAAEGEESAVTALV